MDEELLMGYGHGPEPLVGADGDAEGSLLAFYRSRCDAFQAERKEMMDRFRDLETSREARHAVDWQNKMHKQEISELKGELTRVRDEVQGAREVIATLESDKAALKIQEAEDRKRIQHLLSLTQPIAEEVTFYKDCRPGHATRYPVLDELPVDAFSPLSMRSNVSLAAEAAGYRGTRSMSTKCYQLTHRTKQTHAPSTQPKSRVIRTVYLPSEQADTLLQRVQLLTKELDDHKALSSQRIQALLNDLALVNAELKKERDEHTKQLESNGAELEKTKRLLTKATKDYLVARHNAQDAARQAQEEIVHLYQVQTRIEKEKDLVRTQAQQETQAIRMSVREEGNQNAEEFRKQAMARERDIHILKEQYAAVQETYGARIHSLQSRLTTLRGRYKGLENRRNMEMEGFSRDVATLKRHIVKLESLCFGAKLTQDELRGLRVDESNVFSSNQLNSELAHLQKRYADLATELSHHYNR
ncbi:hypothetical protein, variant [Saprolegnia diclina VS20]|uniref:Uncharacterized protein n=1 Tax=Saprolegnia diclina (strain VS20) TaxID=1156394 RepID=T0PJV1_SAPDV|nr:hypothetical protein, variant [Saprolegnia diclina VS20]EQC25664.1 hypothetical protein, variant [Saprolegnia diclina VS20]|eukprot:XP_008620908.1 hypothetical protein, variant [Saprolegnia diclina VS20]